MRPLSADLEDPEARPYVRWGIDVSVAELRCQLDPAEPGTRARWIARVMREARYEDVWRFESLQDVLDGCDRVQLHLGRRRDFWRFLFEGWRADGLIA